MIHGRRCSLVLCARCDRLQRAPIVAVPPTAPERLEQGDGIGIATCHGSHIGDPCLLVGLLCRQQGHVIECAIVILFLDQIEAGFGGAQGVVFGLERLRVIVERCQGVSYVLERLEHHQAVLRSRLIVGVDRGAALGSKRAPPERAAALCLPQGSTCWTRLSEG